MLSSFVAVAVVAGGFLSASAQSLNLSSQCQSVLASVAASTDGQCLNAGGLIPLALAGSDTSLVTPFNGWLTGLCSQPACTNSSLSTIITNVTQGCASDLSALGYTPDALPSVIASVQEYYPVVRQVACLKDNSANQLCVTEELNTVQSSTGPLTVNSITALVPKLLAGGLSSLNLPANATCNNCTKEAFNIISQAYPDSFSSDDKTAATNACGASFIDGTQPSGVTQTAAGLSLPSVGDQNAAVMNFPMGTLAASLIALAAGFVAFA